MIGFLGGSGFQMRPGRRIAGQRRLAVVQRLRANLAGMVHAHQACGMAAVLRVEFG